MNKTKARSEHIRKRAKIEEKYSWDRMSDADVRKPTSSKAKESVDEAQDEDDAEAHALEQSSQINGAMKLIAGLWKRTSVEWPAIEGEKSLGYDADASKALQARQKQNVGNEAPGKRQKFKRSVYLQWKEGCVRSWSK